MERTPMERALSTDQLMDMVLSHLNVQDLLDCRLVSKFWNKAASSVLRRRYTMIKNISKTKTLKKLEECLKQSWNFPFAGLIVDQPWKFSSADGMEFFKNHGARFTCLRLVTSPEARLQDQTPFINHLARLSLLQLEWCQDPAPHAEFLAAGQKDARILNLPLLRTLRIFSAGLNQDILREICSTASPSLQIECLETSYGILQALKSTGKLQAVTEMTVQPDINGENLRADELRITKLLSIESPSLTKLDFSAAGCICREGLMRLLISSQHTLEELRLAGMYQFHFFSKFPVLAKLSKFSVKISDEDDRYTDDNEYEYLFQGSHGHKFPALQELELDIRKGFKFFNLSDGSLIVPSLKKIHYYGYIGKAKIEDLARCFPNVIEVRLKHDVYDFERSCDVDPTDIWSVGAFKKLEKLVIWPYTFQSPTKMFDNLEKHAPSIEFKNFKILNMDSFLTGMPIGICENLRKRPQQNLKDSPFNEILRDSPNLLQLKNLKELIVCVRLEDELDQLPEEPPFISMVSVRYALEMMPNLTAKFVYEHSLPAWRCDEEDEVEVEYDYKIVTKLKTAFKHVKQYIELEPFYY